MDSRVSTVTFPCKIRPPTSVEAKIGLILLSTDEIGGDAFCSIMPKERTQVFTTRTAYLDESDQGGEFQLRTSFGEVADTLPPQGRFDVLAFSCTNATVAIGIDSLIRQLRAARPGVKYTSPAIACVKALRSLKARRIALLTPYVIGIHELFMPFFRDNGIAVTADGTFGLETDAEIGELARESIFKASKALVRNARPDALFISCTATPIVPYIARLEKEIGVPVVSSTQAMAWDALRLAGYRRPIRGFGRLLAVTRR